MRPHARAVTAAALLAATALPAATTGCDLVPSVVHPHVSPTTVADQPGAVRSDPGRQMTATTPPLRGRARAAAQPPVRTRPRATAVELRGTRLRPVGDVAPPPVLRARAWAVADLDSGEILGRHWDRARLPQASTIKVLTALTAVRRVPSSVPVRATRRAANTGCTCAGVVAGRRYPRRMLLAGMLTSSGNDAAEALAGGDRRSRGAFISAMNHLADRLGATDTVAKNPSGLDAPGAHSSARDLIVLLRAAAQEPQVARWLDVRGVSFGSLHTRRHWLWTGTDFGQLHPQSYAAKSGYTSKADNTLVTATRLHGHRIAVAVMGSPSGRTTTDAWALTRWAAQNTRALAPVGRLP